MRQLAILAALLLAACAASPESSRITYTRDGTDMIATLSNGERIRVPCQFTSTRTVSRVLQDVDNCEMASRHIQYVQELEAQVSAQAEPASP